MKKIRVVIVDDSPTMRRLLRAAIADDPRLEVVAEAANAIMARDAVNKHAPDVLTLDVEMPQMNGIEFLSRLMRHRPMPVVMVSTLTHSGSEAAIEALSLGAVDCIDKASLQAGGADLADMLVTAAAARVRTLPAQPLAAPAAAPTGDADPDALILIGGSTGAVEAIERILVGFPADCPPTLITQHMPAAFLASFAARLNNRVAPEVSLAKHDQPLAFGQVLLAPGGAHHMEIGPHRRIRLIEGPTVSGHRPSVDVMFRSAVPFAKHTIAAILTGMGRDGADGMRALRSAGAHTIGQNQESCIVFGMPRVAGELGGVDTWVPLDEIAGQIIAASRARPVRMMR